MPSNFRTMGTELPICMGTQEIYFGSPNYLYGYPVVHEPVYTTYKNWRCDYCNNVNKIEDLKCSMCNADLPRKYDK